MKSVGFLLVLGVLISCGCDRKPSSGSSGSSSERKWGARTEKEEQLIESGARLRQVGNGLSLYEENKHKPPATLQDMITAMELPAEILQSARPGCSFVYTGKSILRSPKKTVIAYEQGSAERLNILFMGGHVEWYEAKAAKRIIEKGREED